MLRLLVMCMVWHFCGWKSMSQSDSHRCRESRSSWRAIVLLVVDGVVDDGVVGKKFNRTLNCFEYSQGGH